MSMSASRQLCGMSYGALIVYNRLINKKQQGHLWWLLFGLMDTVVLSFYSGTCLHSGHEEPENNYWRWAPVLSHLPYLILSGTQKTPGEGTELICFSKSPAFPFMCLITHILLRLWPTNHSWLLQFGKCDPLSWLLLFLLVFRALLYIWYGNCFILQQGEPSISANCHSRSCLKLDSSEIIFMIKH